ncbi:methylenetetrahydrofolate reductase [Pelagibius litoralis]|uniref:methylenetetrahydrofolate reductase n=1 Tax=Pelagibius litoralis TaxID=374515 RepID=UPI00197F4706|nr:methylenetetrahydrofolate reductase [Pelagibius litoralis]
MSKADAVDTAAEETRQQIIDLLQGFTIETTPGSAAKIPDYREHLRPGARVAVTFLPGSDFADTVATARRLRQEGFEPMPHFAARSIPSRDALEGYLQALKDSVDIKHVVALAGAVDSPLGPFESSMDILETGLFDKYGIETIGIAGHPEGSPDISPSGLQEALTWKNTFAERSDASLYIATQFCFEAAPIIAWDKAIRAAGNHLPIHIGVPGLATIKTLINHAKACGVGPSMRFLTRQARNVAKLMTVNAPDKLLLDLARYKALDPDCGIARVHMYPLGGLRRSAAWSYAVADGHFDLKPKEKGFNVTLHIE